ncbi:MAG: hypothetical protein NW224_24020 [Leptolyngbyaceae cyanobacterium bins.302]|nr:hypothetical protein [Leptolyngbyaceae cyanobacterium bins.302]
MICRLENVYIPNRRSPYPDSIPLNLIEESDRHNPINRLQAINNMINELGQLLIHIALSDRWF